MPFREQPADFLGAPHYPSPNYTEDGTVVRVYVPQDGTVGWLVLQGQAIEWYSAVSADHLGYGVRQHVNRTIEDGALDRVPASTLWERLLKETLHTPPVQRPYADVLDEIRAARGAAG